MLAQSVHTAVAVSCEGLDLCLIVQPQRLGLAASVNLGPQQGMGVVGGTEDIFKHLAPMNMKPMRENINSKICRVQGDWAGLWFLQWQRLLGSPAEKAIENHGHFYYVPNTGCLCPLPCSRLSLFVSALLISG